MFDKYSDEQKTALIKAPVIYVVTEKGFRHLYNGEGFSGDKDYVTAVEIMDDNCNVNCFGCVDCHDCRDCQDCTNCINCSSCWGCTDCYDCEKCEECSDCISSAYCGGCKNCTNCRACNNVSGDKNLCGKTVRGNCPCFTTQWVFK